MNTRLAPVALALATLALGCRDNTASVEPFGICTAPAADTCTFAGTCDAYVGSTAINLDLTQQLVIGVELHNQLANNSNKDTGGVNTHDAFIRQIVMSYSGGGLSIGGRTVDLQRTVPAAGTAVVSFTPVDAVAGAEIATALGAAGEANLIAAAKFKGNYADGSEFESGAFDIPVYVCTGCGTYLTPTCSDPTQTVTALCPANPGQWPISSTCG